MLRSNLLAEKADLIEKVRKLNESKLTKLIENLSEKWPDLLEKKENNKFRLLVYSFNREQLEFASISIK